MEESRQSLYGLEIGGIDKMKSKLDVFNQTKKKSETLTLIGIMLVVLAFIIYMAIYSATASEDMAAIAFIVGLAGFIVGAVGLTQFNMLKRRFKKEVLKAYFSEALPGTEYYPERGLSQMEVYATEFLKRADRFYTEDLLTGNIDDVGFISSDVRLEERHVQHTQNGTRVYYVPYFVGRVFRFTFNKPFDGYLQVLEAGSPLSNRPFKKVKLESIDFNKQFKTYATEEISAFYVLTPDIMEAIMELEKRNPGRIGFSFSEKDLYIAINNNRDTFEIKMFRKIDQAMMDSFKQDILAVRDFINLLKLNKKIFKEI